LGVKTSQSKTTISNRIRFMNHAPTEYSVSDFIAAQRVFATY